MTKQINISDENYIKLEKLKDQARLPRKRGAKKGISFNAIIEELITAYWNPVIRDIWLHEEFSTFSAKLRARGLATDEIDESLARIRAKILRFGKKEVE